MNSKQLHTYNFFRRKNIAKYRYFELNWIIASDFLFFLLTAGLPSYFFGLINQNTFYIKGVLDTNLLQFFLSIPLLFISFSQIRVLKKLSLLNYLKIIIFYILFEFTLSLFIHNIAINESFTILRTFFSPISLFAMLLYVSSMDVDRIHRFIYWILYATLIQGVFFIIFYATGFSVFGVTDTMAEGSITIGATRIVRYFMAYPMFNSVLFLVSIINFFSTKKTFWLLCLGVSILSMLFISTRSELFTFIIMASIVIFLQFKIKSPNRIIKNLCIVGSLFVFMIFYIFAFENYFTYFSSRISEVQDFTKVDESINYSFRQDLIDQAYSSIEANNFLFLGLGYQRASQSGDYDLVLGVDTNIAPILFTEGFLGLVLRIIPFLALLLNNIRELFFDKGRPMYVLNIFTISIIVSEFINFMQTTIFRSFSGIVFILFLFEIVKFKYYQSFKYYPRIKTIKF
jgi:hypothetical protein